MRLLLVSFLLLSASAIPALSDDSINWARVKKSVQEAVSQIKSARIQRELQLLKDRRQPVPRGVKRPAGGLFKSKTFQKLPTGWRQTWEKIEKLIKDPDILDKDANDSIKILEEWLVAHKTALNEEISLETIELIAQAALVRDSYLVNEASANSLLRLLNTFWLNVYEMRGAKKIHVGYNPQIDPYIMAAVDRVYKHAKNPVVKENILIKLAGMHFGAPYSKKELEMSWKILEREAASDEGKDVLKFIQVKLKELRSK